MKKLFSILCSNYIMNRIINKLICFLQYIIGIGSGTDTRTSGEISILKRIKNKENDVCIFDVGSNKGQYLESVLLELGKKNMSIHCFEPSISAFSILSKKYNKLNKVTLNNFGLGETKENRVLYYDTEASGLASLTKRRLDHIDIQLSKSENVCIDTADNYCKLNKISYINLLKIDVEGHELEVLNGTVEMLEERKIEIITFEFGGCNIDTRTYFQDFYYFFKKYGMNIYRITPTGYLFPIEYYSEELEQFRTSNYMSVRIHN